MSTTQIVILSITGLLSFVATIAPLVWAAIQDGRYDAAQRGA